MSWKASRYGMEHKSFHQGYIQLHSLNLVVIAIVVIVLVSIVVVANSILITVLTMIAACIIVGTNDM